MNLLKYIILIVSIFLFTLLETFAAVFDFTVSPVKYEIEANTGSIITKTALLYNFSDEIQTVYTTKANFISTDNTGNPTFIRDSSSITLNTELASWITIDTESFILQAGEKKEITFTITVPDNATPGGHYGAVFFKTNNSNQLSGSQIDVKIDYGVLVLVNIAGKIITKGDIDETVINTNYGGGGSSYRNLTKDDCSIDLTKSRYDGKCIDSFFDRNSIQADVANLNIGNESELDLSDFNISFLTLFKNEGNTHLKPTGTIKLVDEDGKQLKGIGKKLLTNNVGAIIGEKIVNYIPINDNGGNVLPGTNRNFNSEWKGFPYEAYDENGKKIIKYWTPEEYYTRQNVQERGFLLPWERVNERISKKTINAYIDLSYIDNEGETVEFNSAKEFQVSYKEKYIGLNPYVFIYGFLIIFILYLLWLLFKKKTTKCINKQCNKKLRSDMKICPYCGTKQKNKNNAKKK